MPRTAQPRPFSPLPKGGEGSETFAARIFVAESCGLANQRFVPPNLKSADPDPLLERHAMTTSRRTPKPAAMTCFASVLCLSLLGLVALADEPTKAGGGASLAATDDLRPISDFFQLPPDWKLGACSAVAVNRKGEIIVFHRGEHPLIVFDAAGKFVRSWGDDLVKAAHGLRVDRDDNVWTTDMNGHRVFKFDPTGKLLLSLGTGKAGAEHDQFNKPTDIAFGSNGEFFITDGYGNTRVMKFAASGKWLMSWGQPGKADGQFNLPHAIVIDAKGRLLVGDRENNRVQVFDQDGKWLATWPGFAPFGLARDLTGRIYVADAQAHQILRLNAAGEVERRWGRKGSAPGEFELPHMLTFDASGQLYVAEINGLRVQKFAPLR